MGNRDTGYAPRASLDHSNTKLPVQLDRVLRLVLVPPDMHRVPHSAIGDETDSNYGFTLPWWDRVFGVYVDQPEAGHDGMQIGQSKWRETRDQSLWDLLVQPRFKP